MTGRQPVSDEPESYHRQWLHAMEAEPTVPGTVMQVARLYADYAVSRGGHSASVSYPALTRQTHRSRGTLVEAHEWMTDHGWLRLRPGEDGEPWHDGQRKAYDLTFGGPGEKRDPVRLPERSEALNQSGSRNGRAPNHSGDQNGSVKGNRSGSRNATVLASELEPFQSPERERLTSDNVSLPEPGSLHAQLAAVVPDVTERETELVIQMLRERPAVQSGSAVLPREIKDGNGPALVAAARRRAPGQPHYRDLCTRCSRTGHDADDCPDRDPADGPPRAEHPVALADVGERCSYEPCHSPGPIPVGAVYHETCARLADIKARAEREEAARRRALKDAAARPDGGHAV